MSDYPMIHIWCGRRIEELTYDEILEALRACMSESAKLHAQVMRLSPHVDWPRYLMTPNV
jgi:hypothetical protein